MLGRGRHFPKKVQKTLRIFGSCASQQIGQGLLDDDIFTGGGVNLFDNRFINHPSKSKLVKKDDLFFVHQINYLLTRVQKLIPVSRLTLPGAYISVATC